MATYTDTRVVSRLVRVALIAAVAVLAAVWIAASHGEEGAARDWRLSAA
jgi:hypothetical protein